VTPLLLDLLLLRKRLLQLLPGDQLLVHEDLADRPALVEVVQGAVDLLLRDPHFEQDLAEILARLLGLDPQGAVQLFPAYDALVDENLPQGLFAARSRFGFHLFLSLLCCSFRPATGRTDETEPLSSKFHAMPGHSAA